MKFTIEAKELLRVLNILSKNIDKKSTLSILTTALLEKREDGFYMTGSTFESSLTLRVDLSEIVGDLFPMCLQVSQLQSIVSTLGDQKIIVEVDEENGNVTYHYMNGKFELPYLKADDYPTFPKIASTPTIAFDLDYSLLLENLMSASVCAGLHDELHPVMSSILLDIIPEGVTFVGTNGCLLYKNDYMPGVPFASVGTEAKLLFPGCFVSPFAAAFKGKDIVHIEADDARLRIYTDDVSFSLRMIDGRYPNYNSVIPKEQSYSVKVKVKELKTVLSRVSLFSSESECISLEFNGENVLLRGVDLDFSQSASESLPCADSNLPEGFEIGVKGSTLSSLLSLIGTDNVVFNFDDSSRPIIINEDANDSSLVLLQVPLLLG